MATTRTISDAFSPIFSNMLLISRSQGHIRKIRARTGRDRMPGKPIQVRALLEPSSSRPFLVLPH